jgi:hypothetical protein
MKYAVRIGLGAMVYIPSFIKIGLAIQKLNGYRISLLSFCRNKQSILKSRGKCGCCVVRGIYIHV